MLRTFTDSDLAAAVAGRYDPRSQRSAQDDEANVDQPRAGVDTGPLELITAGLLDDIKVRSLSNRRPQALHNEIRSLAGRSTFKDTTASA